MKNIIKMEEKKMTKEVSINTTKTSQGERKATYEELNNYCVQLYNQNKQLTAQLQQKEMFNLFKRLDYLFMVLKNKDCFSPDIVDASFVADCAKEIVAALTVPEETADKEEGKGE